MSRFHPQQTSTARVGASVTHRLLAAAGIREDGKTPLFRSAVGKTGVLTDKPMNRIDAYRMVRRRTAEAGFKVKLGCHVFRATDEAAKKSRKRRDARSPASAIIAGTTSALCKVAVVTGIAVSTTGGTLRRSALTASALAIFSRRSRREGACFGKESRATQIIDELA